jgi:hypothetical protein
MTISMVFVCFTSGEGQAPQCHPAYPKQYASADECEVFSQNDTYLKNYLKGVGNGQYQRGVSVEVLGMKKTVIEGFSHFVTSTTAPIASGWSGCRIGFAPTRKRRLCTAHTRSGHCRSGLDRAALARPQERLSCSQREICRFLPVVHLLLTASPNHSFAPQAVIQRLAR